MANKQFLDKDGVDYLTQGLKAKIPTKVSQLTNDSGYKTTDNDTKNTAGSTDTSSKIFLIGATSQAANPQTYSHDTTYVGTDGCLYSGSKKVLTEHQSLSGLVPTSRTVNGKALSSNITLTASDVGALPNTTVIPTVNNATLTIQKNGTNVKTFTANASTDVVANITVPTKTSELNNDSGFLTSHQDISGKVNKSGDTMTGALNFKNATYNKFGDDVEVGDKDISGTLVLHGLNGATGLQFNPYSGTVAQKISTNGSGEMTITENLTVTKTIKTSTGDVQLANGAIIHYNSTDKCIEFNFN